MSTEYEDVSLMRVACAALDEAADWIAYRVGTYDEQPGEAEALRRVKDASGSLKIRLAALHMSQDCVFLGIGAGIDIKFGNGLVIIGDGIRDLNPEHNETALFLGRNVAIGDTLFGEPFDLKKRILSRFGGPVNA